jgi:hypothetical protein
VNKALDAANAFNDNSKHMSGYANHNGLSPLGRFLIGKMMDLGMIIDIDHMSGKTISEALAQTASRGDSGYPLIAGHCSFRALSWPRDTHDPALVPSHKWPSEANMSNETLSQLVTRGGMVSPITVGGDVRSEGGTVANDAPGTSRSWAQAYLHAIHAMGGRNVGIATDMALNGGLGPRFGPMGAAGFDGDYPRALAASIEQRSRTGSPYPAPPNNAQLNDPDWRANFIRIVRRSAVQAQASPVRYTTPLKSWHDFRQADDSVYRYDGDGLIGDDERDAYFAIALHRSGESWTAIKQSIKREEAMPARGIGDTLGRAIDDQHTLGKLLDGRRQWIVNVAKGLDGIVEPLPKLWPADMFHGPIVQRAARDVLAGVHSSADPEYLQYRAAIQFASDLFNALDRGTNPPLTRFVTKSHEYDFNLDGFSTYGLMPDMLQDAKNSGMSAVDLAPLFRSAEDYIQLWERCAP